MMFSLLTVMLCFFLYPSPTSPRLYSLLSFKTLNTQHSSVISHSLTLFSISFCQLPLSSIHNILLLAANYLSPSTLYHLSLACNIQSILNLSTHTYHPATVTPICCLVMLPDFCHSSCTLHPFVLFSKIHSLSVKSFPKPPCSQLPRLCVVFCFIFPNSTYVSLSCLTIYFLFFSLSFSLLTLQVLILSPFYISFSLLSNSTHGLLFYESICSLFLKLFLFCLSL